MKINLSTLDHALTSVKKYKNIIVGFSGGIDSTVLLYGVCLLARKGLLRSNIKAIHVNHGLNDSCEEWRRSVDEFVRLIMWIFRLKILKD